MSYRFLLLLLLLMPSVVFSQDNVPLLRLIEESRRQNLSADPVWRSLLHYHPNVFGADSSDIDGPQFFVAKEGRSNPQQELEATLISFFEPLSTDAEVQHPRCRYPARAAWLNEKLGTEKELPPLVCDRFIAWKEKLDPASISIIFSAYYLNNPASMYGHTFLRIGRKSAPNEENPLLDYTVNFAAQTNTKNGLAFAVLGLAGGYPGNFSTNPYYMKVQQYNNLESRDLWEYKLNFSQEEVDRLIAHLWEMGPTNISYYFLNKNCSYQLLPMLEVARPTLDLSRNFRFRAIPVDTLKKVIRQKGLVAKSVFRPSALRKMMTSRDDLNDNERKIAQSLATTLRVGVEEDLSPLPKERQKKVLDSAYDLLRYRSGFYRSQPEDVQARERRILLLVNALPAGLSKEKLRIPEPPAPELAHKTGRAGLAIGATRDSAFEEFSVRGALHDLEADATGFVGGSQLEMMSLRLRYINEGKKLMVEEATGIDIKSLAPWEPWIHKPSWKFKIHYSRAHDLNRAPEGSGQAGLTGGSGLAFNVPFLKEGLIYSMIEMEGMVGSVFRDDYRLGIGPLVGIVGALHPRWRVHFNAAYIRYGAGDISSANRLKLIQSVRLTNDWELRAILERQNYYREGLVSINRYF